MRLTVMRNSVPIRFMAFGAVLASLLASTSATAQSGNIAGLISLLLLDEPKYKEVTSATGRIWLDRNLGATRVARSPSDTAAFGDLYQWGRLTDGHQKRNSATRSTLSSTDVPGHSDFITANAPFDWRSPQNPALWQGSDGINNPCPKGFALPTESELLAERNSWVSANATGAFASPLKWVMAGYRNHYLGGIEKTGSAGSYWSRTTVVFSVWPNVYRSRNLDFAGMSASIHTNVHAAGRSVRCIKPLIMLP